MRTYQQGLWISIADAADTAAAMKGSHIFLKFGSERCVFNIVNLTLKAGMAIVDRDTAPQCAEVRVLVCTEKDIKDAILF